MAVNGLVKIKHPLFDRNTKKTLTEELFARPMKRTYSVAEIASGLGITIEQLRKMVSTMTAKPDLASALNQRVTLSHAYGRDLTDDEPYEVLSPADAEHLTEEEQNAAPYYEPGK